MSESFSKRLLTWFRKCGRHDLPWQGNPTPYRVWVSEIMLQQTQVKTVIPYYERFMQRFPDIQALAAGSIDEVLHLWTGLGYYARGRNLHTTARIISDSYQGKFPETMDALVKLPGIGRSTAGAILALACQQRHPILDGNVKRVLCRYHAIDGWPGDGRVNKRLWELADTHTTNKQVAEYTQAIMDLGATVCTRRQPQCGNCPVNGDCQALLADRVNEFPVAKPRKQRPVNHTTFVIMEDKDRQVLLERRPPSGIWGGLWGFPQHDSDTGLGDVVYERFGFQARECRYLKPIRHTFSHFQLEISPVYLKGQLQHDRVADSEQYYWYPLDGEVALGMAAPVKKLLNSLLSAKTEVTR